MQRGRGQDYIVLTLRMSRRQKMIQMGRRGQLLLLFLIHILIITVLIPPSTMQPLLWWIIQQLQSCSTSDTSNSTTTIPQGILYRCKGACQCCNSILPLFYHLHPPWGSIDITGLLLLLFLKTKRGMIFLWGPAWKIQGYQIDFGNKESIRVWPHTTQFKIRELRCKKKCTFSNSIKIEDSITRSWYYS